MIRLLACVLILLLASATHARDRWAPDQAQSWGKDHPWLVGCNFGPSTASNELEM